MKRVWQFTGLLIGASLFSPSNALAHVIGITIDSFDTPQEVGELGASQVAENGGIILGGFRDLSGNASINNSVSSGSGLMTWDGDDSPFTVDTTGLGGLDLTQDGEATDFEVEILLSDLSGMQLTLNVFDMNSNVSTLSRVFNSAILTPTTELFSFTTFTGTADFTNIGAIQLRVAGPPEIDVQIGSIETFGPHSQGPLPVPESSSSLALLSGAMLLVASRKIRRR